MIQRNKPLSPQGQHPKKRIRCPNSPAQLEKEEFVAIDLIGELCEKFNVELVDVAIQRDYPARCGMPTGDFVNRSFHIGGSTIVLGIYDDPELRTASFFHELGHLYLDHKSMISHGLYDSVPYFHEVYAWKCGMEMAREMSIGFSNETMEWCKSQLAGYLKNLQRDVVGKCYDVAMLSSDKMAVSSI